MGARKGTVRIGVVGAFDSTRPTYVATSEAIAHSAAALRLQAETAWLATESLCREGQISLEIFDGFFIAPGSPCRSLHGATTAERVHRRGRGEARRE
jgi:CTP synthase (UTP-ammonia lyase)